MLTTLISELNSNGQLRRTGEICTVHIECCFLCDCQQYMHSLMHFPRCLRYSSDTKRIGNKALNVNIRHFVLILHTNNYRSVNFLLPIFYDQVHTELKLVFIDGFVQSFNLAWYHCYSVLFTQSFVTYFA